MDTLLSPIINSWYSILGQVKQVSIYEPYQTTDTPLPLDKKVWSLSHAKFVALEFN